MSPHLVLIRYAHDEITAIRMINPSVLPPSIATEMAIQPLHSRFGYESRKLAHIIPKKLQRARTAKVILTL